MDSSRPTPDLRTEPTSGLAYRHHESPRSAPRTLIVLLHGVGGNEHNLAPLVPALEGFADVVLVRGPLQLGAGQHGWFRVAFDPEGPRPDLAAAEAARLQLHRFVGALQRQTGIPPAATLIAGFSQGGIMSASLALTEPATVRGFAILSGRILPELAPRLAPRERLARVQAFVSHGEADPVLPVAWATRAEAWLAELGVPTEAHRYEAGHALTPAMAADFAHWAEERLAPPTVRLRLDDEGLHLAGAAGDARVALRLAGLGLAPGVPTPLALETAIQHIEDALQPAARRFAPGATLRTADAWFAGLARFAGAPADTLDRDTLERAFSRLAALAEGRPERQDPLPADPLFAARLVVLRELMHHLDFHALRGIDAPS
ncbi:MAG: hypothetical protein REI09_06475 [Candidatus Dactylopiibacterium sp.]|nr:hypothetical protein [Candidatus Dactylopiibacterium sp.]